MKYESRITSITVVPVDQPIFSEYATTTTIVNEAAGEFVEVSQTGHVDLRKIAITKQEWPMLRESIEKLLADCRDTEDGDE